MDEPKRRPSLRFTIRAMLLATAATAVFTASIVVLPSTVGILVLASLFPICASALIAAGSNSQGRIRGFAFGAALPQVIAAVYVYDLFAELVQIAVGGHLLAYPYVPMYDNVRRSTAAIVVATLGLSCITGFVWAATMSAFRHRVVS